MDGNKVADGTRPDRARVTAAQWFAGGQRIPYDPGSARVLTEQEAAATPGALRVFERVAAAALGSAAAQVLIITCLNHRADPAIVRACRSGFRACVLGHDGDRRPRADTD